MPIRQSRVLTKGKKNLVLFSKIVNIDKKLSVSWAILLILILSWSYVTAASYLTVFASAGTKPAIDEICRGFEERYGINVKIIYGGGGEVLSQMILSGSGDAYIAPEQRFMESAEQQGVIDPETKRTIAHMLPAIAVSKGNPKRITILSDLAKPGIRVAVTRPETTLLGKFAPEIFRKAGLAEAIEQNIVTTALRPDSVVTMLLLDQIDAGIIWHFYQRLAPEAIETIPLLPEQLTGIGEMQIALATYSENKKAALQFIDFVISHKGKAIFAKHGYILDIRDLQDYRH